MNERPTTLMELLRWCKMLLQLQNGIIVMHFYAYIQIQTFAFPILEIPRHFLTWSKIVFLLPTFSLLPPNPLRHKPSKSQCLVTSQKHIYIYILTIQTAATLPPKNTWHHMAHHPNEVPWEPLPLYDLIIIIIFDFNLLPSLHMNT